MSMITDLKDFRNIDMLVDKKNIIIFPVSKSNELFEDGVNYTYRTAFHPIELLAPYSNEELASKIKEGIDSWNVYPPYETFTGKNTFEEKYFGIKGFKKAILGKKFIRLGWDDLSGKEVSILWPQKKGYGYICIENIQLKKDADYFDFANAVIELINLDLVNHPRFKKNEKLLLKEEGK